MYSLFGSKIRWLVLLTCISPGLGSEADHVDWLLGGGVDDPGLARYVSRPDLASPKWDVKIYHPDLVADGYWFVSPYKALDADSLDDNDNIPDIDTNSFAARAFRGPHIYDGKTGELIWSGTSSYPFFSQGNVEDFRLSTVQGSDEPMLTFMSAGTGQAVVMGSDYAIKETLQVDTPGNVNTHELNFVENGTRALVIKSHRQQGTKEMSRKVGFEGKCVGQFDGFEEFDTKTWKSTFDWRSFGKVGFEESSLEGRPIEQRCRDWDFIHSNSVDKTPEGDYLWSSRHCDTIFKISGKDGHIIWRLGGKKSDFKHVGHDMIFSRQHNIRQRSKNSTHTIITILDNAKGVDRQAPTWPYSRGMQIALDEKHMTATVEHTYPHPDGVGGFAPRRGNYQILTNGNIFMGWSEQAKQSEHSPDGTIVMEAVFKTHWLGGYRNYKFPFVGHPTEPPVAHSQAFAAPNNSTVTTVHVSWNGATEVAKWNLYRTVANGQVNVLVATAEKLGFETVLSWGGYASYIIAEAVDRNETVLGRSSVMKTYVHPNVTAEAVKEEESWLEELLGEKEGWVARVVTSPVGAFLLGVLCTVAVMYVVVLVRRRGLWRRWVGEESMLVYARVPDADELEVPLRSAKGEGRLEDGR